MVYWYHKLWANIFSFLIGIMSQAYNLHVAILNTFYFATASSCQVWNQYDWVGLENYYAREGFKGVLDLYQISQMSHLGWPYSNSFSTDRFWISQEVGRLLEIWPKQAYIPCAFSYYMSDDWFVETIHMGGCTSGHVAKCELISGFFFYSLFYFNFSPMWAWQVYGSDHVTWSNSLKIGMTQNWVNRTAKLESTTVYACLIVHIHVYVQYDMLLIRTSVLSWCL